MNLPWYVFGRPIKPVALVLMNTMLILGEIGITNNGALRDSMWADVIGMVSFGVAILFIVAFIKNSQRGAEWALIGAFFVWGVRFWALILVNGLEAFTREGAWLALCWMMLAGGSWLLERSDPYVHGKRRGSKWSRR
jgi:hypothetical protein